eukprot:355328-Chlamydomonas_euryale.AAC.3
MYACPPPRASASALLVVGQPSQAFRLSPPAHLLASPGPLLLPILVSLSLAGPSAPSHFRVPQARRPSPRPTLMCAGTSGRSSGCTPAPRPSAMMDPSSADC